MAAPRASTLVVTGGGEINTGGLSTPRSPGVRSRARAAETEQQHGFAPVPEQARPSSAGPGYDTLQTVKSHALPGAFELPVHLPVHHEHMLGPHGILKPLFAVWFAACSLIVVVCLRSADRAGEELFYIYYQGLLPVLTMLWLWGVVVRYFERRSIKYDACFSQGEQRFLLNSRQVFQAAGLATTVVLTSAATFCVHSLYYQMPAASVHPPTMYTLMLLLLVVPSSFAFGETRMFFSQTLLRVMTPFRQVTWSDFLLADVLTSLAKPLSDCERALCHLLTGPVMLPASTIQVCGSSSLLIPFTLCLPYLWRLCQCVRVWKDTGARPQLFNALKYSTAFPVIIISSVQFQVTEERWQAVYKPLWLLAAALNSGYSYYWDIERDWGISFFSSSSDEKVLGIRKPMLHREGAFHRVFYSYLMISNLVLRLSWTYKLSPHLRQNHLTVLCFTLLEVFRRFQWMFVRIEVELHKLQTTHPELGQLVPAQTLSAKDGTVNII